MLLLTCVLSSVLAFLANCQLYHGFELPDEPFFDAEPWEYDLMVFDPPLNRFVPYAPFPQPMRRRVSTSFFKPMPADKPESTESPARKIESKAYAKKYFGHRRPVVRSRHGRRQVDPVEQETRHIMKQMAIKRRERGEEDEKVPREEKRRSRYQDDLVLQKIASLNGDSVRKQVRRVSRGINRAIQSARLPRVRFALRRNTVGPLATEPLPAVLMKDPKRKRHEDKQRRLKRRRDEEAKRKRRFWPFSESDRRERPVRLDAPDPLESPLVRLAVAVALGALVTCGIYAVAGFICLLFPGFFGDDKEASGYELLSGEEAARPVRQIPLPRENRMVETAL